jgi:hypothetical protein
VPPRRARRVLDDGEVACGDVLEVRVGLHALVDIGLLVGLQGSAVAPDVDAAVGAGFGVGEPGLGDQAGKSGEGRGYGLDQGALLLLAYALQVEVDDRNVHSFPPRMFSGDLSPEFVSQTSSFRLNP